MMTVLTVRSIARLRSDVSRRYSDSGVVTRMCGGVRSIAARSDWVVSPVRTGAGRRGGAGGVAVARSAPPPDRGDPGGVESSCFRDSANAPARFRKVLVNVCAQRFERGDIK